MKDLTVDELKMIKFDLIGKIQTFQKTTREIDKLIKQKLMEDN